MTRRIGILTGGGDCPGLNAVIRAAVKAGVREHGFEVIGIESGFDGLVHPATRAFTPEMIRGILHKGGTLLRTTNRGDPFAYPSAADAKICEDRSKDVVRNITDLSIDGLIVIGGDGTLRIAGRLGEMGVPIVAVPKTIDNDLGSTDYTFGFMTAVAIATEAVDRLHTTAESHNRVMILEVMGRTAGWIALYAGMAGGADIILIPEIPYEVDRIVSSIVERKQGGANFDIIVVAEGAKRRGGEEVYAEKTTKRLGGIAYQVAEDIRQRIDLEVRVTVLGHVQRGGSPIAFDRILATRFGKAAIDLVAAGEFGKMVSLRQNRIVSVPIQDAIGNLKLVDPDGEVVATARSLGISFADEE